MKFLHTLTIASFALAIGLAGCAPPADDEPKTDAETPVVEAPPAIVPTPEPAPPPPVAVAPKPKPKPQPPKVVEPPPPPEPPPVCQECGVIASVEPVKEKAKGSGAGAVLGAIAGGVIGHQFGGGKGKDVATAAGAIAGGVAGHQAERSIRATSYYRIGVNMENGSYQTVDVNDASGISVGSRVRVVGSNIQLR
ncbi:MAG: glycine zipper 2TM domain-containing protein [Panacagrimonas sp.]